MKGIKGFQARAYQVIGGLPEGPPIRPLRTSSDQREPSPGRDESFYVYGVHCVKKGQKEVKMSAIEA